jgi:hypothetical protein
MATKFVFRHFSFPGNFDKLNKFFLGCTGRQGCSCQVSPSQEISRNPGCNERGGGVHQNNIARRAIFSGENFADSPGIFRGSSAADGFDWSAQNSEMFWSYCEAPDIAALYFGYQRFSC